MVLGVACQVSTTECRNKMQRGKWCQIGETKPEQRKEETPWCFKMVWIKGSYSRIWISNCISQVFLFWEGCFRAWWTEILSSFLLLIQLGCCKTLKICFFPPRIFSSLWMLWKSWKYRMIICFLANFWIIVAFFYLCTDLCIRVVDAFWTEFLCHNTSDSLKFSVSNRQVCIEDCLTCMVQHNHLVLINRKTGLL